MTVKKYPAAAREAETVLLNIPPMAACTVCGVVQMKSRFRQIIVYKDAQHSWLNSKHEMRCLDCSVPL